MAKVFGRTDVIEMFARQEVETRVPPMALNHGVGSELVAVPRGENETAREPFEQITQFYFVGFRP